MVLNSEVLCELWFSLVSISFPIKIVEATKIKPFISFAKTQRALDVRPYLKYTSEMKFHSKLFLMSLWRQWLSKISSNWIYEMQVIRTELLPRARNIYIRWYHSMFTPHCLYCGIDFFSQWAFVFPAIVMNQLQRHPYFSPEQVNSNKPYLLLFWI